MVSKKSGKARADSKSRESYRSGARRVYVEPLDNTIAVRYREGAKADADKTLESLGRVRAIDSQRLRIIELSGAARRAAALKHLQQQVDEGMLEFATPVLRDAESQLHQILTDEITVRFKSVLRAKDLKAVEEKYGVIVARQNEFVPNQFVVRVPQSKGLDTLKVASKLDAAKEVEFAAPNFISEHRR